MAVCLCAVCQQSFVQALVGFCSMRHIFYLLVMHAMQGTPVLAALSAA